MQSPARVNKAIFFFAIYWIVSQLVLGTVLLLLDMEETLGIGQVIGLFVPFLFYLLFTKQRPKQVLSWRGLSLKNTLLVVALSLAFLPILQVIYALTALVFVPFISEIDFTASPLWLTLIVAAVFPSLFEEFWFRGAMFTEYQAGGVSIHKTAVITGIFFGLIHLNFHQAIYAAAIGIVYAYLVYYTRSILAPILAHFVNNGIWMTLEYVEPYQVWFQGLLDGGFWLVMGIASLVMLPVVVLCLRQFKKHHAATEIEQEPTIEVEAEPEPEYTLQAPAKPRVYTWGFWWALAILGLFTLLVELGLRLMELDAL